ncbi:MAG: phosphohydrolase, partial [Rhodopirellula sp.]|nr:phosphohydrolase [Rhodopirellula sp.]
IDLGGTGSEPDEGSPEIARPLSDGAFGVSLQDRIKQLMAVADRNAS